MASTNYRLFKSLDADCRHLTWVADVEASSPAAAVRSHYAELGPDEEVPKHLAVITASSLHYLAAAVEVQTRLKFD